MRESDWHQVRAAMALRAQSALAKGEMLWVVFPSGFRSLLCGIQFRPGRIEVKCPDWIGLPDGAFFVDFCGFYF